MYCSDIDQLRPIKDSVERQARNMNRYDGPITRAASQCAPASQHAASHHRRRDRSARSVLFLGKNDLRRPDISRGYLAIGLRQRADLATFGKLRDRLGGELPREGDALALWLMLLRSTRAAGQQSIGQTL
jgi:hypothetical protein